MNKVRQIKLQLNAKRGQILLPSVLLVPLFVLVVYLLFDIANLSVTKVKYQFALDNAAYSQMSSVSSYLNGMAIINGPALYRVMLEAKGKTLNPINNAVEPKPKNVFELFYKAGLFPSVGKDHLEGSEASPSPESVDWDVAYYSGKELSEDDKYPNLIRDASHSKWMVPHPPKLGKDEYVVMLNKDYVKNAAITGERLATEVAEYLRWNYYIGNIYDNLTYIFKSLTQNANMFRAGYFKNVGDCKIKECGKQSAQKLLPYLKLQVDPFQTDTMVMYYQDWAYGSDVHEPYPFLLTKQILETNRDMFLFAHLTPKALSLLQKLDHGIALKQSYKTPANHFNKNLDTKYKPLVHTTVFLQCPRKGNNCVWPNPLPKYSVFLRP